MFHDTVFVLVQALSYSASVTASGYYGAAGSATVQNNYLVDRVSGGGYNSGGFAPQYVQLDFGLSATVCSVCLLVGQAPNGNTQHDIYMGPSSLSLITTLSGYTYSGLWLNTTYNPCRSNVRYVQVYSVSSPSWIAWQKFIVYGV